jgi:hypothetical protein
MKYIVFILLIVLLISCEDPTDRYVKRFDLVNITSADIPDSVNLNSIYIRAKAQADNSCWSNLYFELKRTKDFEYSLKAYGTFESFGNCSDEIITNDTVIHFKPTKLGTYIISTSTNSAETVVDTMVVVE